MYIAVIGAGEADEDQCRTAEDVGRGLAEVGCIVVTGGLGGIMEAACRGAREAGGITVGLLPGDERGAANRWVSVALATGLGELRNGLIVRAAEVVVAVGGGVGTLSEIALALKTGRRVIGLGTWPVDGIERADDAPAAVTAATREIREEGGESTPL